MPTVTEQTGSLKWIIAQIGADATITAVSGYGGAFDKIAPDATSTPYIVAQCMSATDVLTANGNRVYSNQVWQIKALAPASQFASLLTLAIQLDALFGNIRQAGDADTTVSSSVREQEINYAEVLDGTVWQHLGGLYRLAVWLN